MSFGIGIVTRAISVSVLSMAALVACRYPTFDDLPNLDRDGAKPGKKPRGTRLTGVVRQDGVPLAVAGDLRLALVWYPNFTGSWGLPEPSEQCPSPSFSSTVNEPFVSQDRDIADQLPADFSLDIGKRPPKQALPTLAGATLPGIGQLVVYRDGNSNRRLDLKSPAQGSSDEIVGASSFWRTSPFWSPINATVSYELLYAEQDGQALAKGFTLLKVAVDERGLDSGGPVPLDTPIEIVLRNNAKVSAMSCSEICIGGAPRLECPTAPANLPAGGEGTCTPSSEQFLASYEWRRTTCSGCNCTEVSCFYTLDPNQPTLDGWPCPIAN